MKVNLIAVGKLNEDYFREAFSEYEKRLSRFCIFSVRELPESKLPDNPGNAEIAAALEKEAVLIEKALVKDADNIAFCIEGEKVSSEGYSKLINSGKNINLIIGSTHGISPTIKGKCRKISVSDMTFPHRLFRIIVAEQTYRAFQIAAGGRYHSFYQKN
ncbi:MAG: 23S rRNA (pseudouridine(1915)-N(3))-methyltransferase RlmH [Ruminococcus sp.]|jgi:23S rRNA (pseudouridine1915-N3)-methyltransferase|nr:23S rRNA (pseudouridine(1915)-N(3))-methyltransferase RlmH [Ruminococcus sp.]